jgi:uncharacterized membrane protein YeaQ/YmgE (transglycosylase-associated protein family)
MEVGWMFDCHFESMTFLAEIPIGVIGAMIGKTVVRLVW